MGTRKPKPFFYSEDLKDFDKAVIGLYAILSLIVLLVIVFGEPEMKLKAVLLYVMPVQISIYLLLYVSLRNFKTYIIWFSFALFHIALFFIVSNILTAPSRNSIPFTCFNTVLLLIVYQLLRYVSLKFQRREFLTISRDGKDLILNKPISALDYLIGFVYFAILAGLNILMAQV